MDLYKIVHFNRESGSVPFPWFYAFDEGDGRLIRTEFGIKIGTPDRHPDDAEIYQTLASAWSRIPDVNANDATFRLSRILQAHGIAPLNEVYLDWAEDEDRFGATLDEMRFDDLDTHFSLIWYPDLDDLLLFDDNYDWACEINLQGLVNIATIKRK